MIAEEASLLADVDRAASSAPNSQILGLNGEIPLLKFFNRYLPYTIRAVTGFVAAPSRALSPQIDLMIVDARYPLLAQNADGTVRAMLHSLIWAIEIKTNLRSADFKTMWRNAGDIMRIAEEVAGYGITSEPISVRTSAFAYRAAQGVAATTQAFRRAATPDTASLNTWILRLPGSGNQQRGLELQFESNFPRSDQAALHNWHCVQRYSHTALSDLYYEIVQWSDIILGQRNLSLGDIGPQMSDYMTWETDGAPDFLR